MIRTALARLFGRRDAVPVAKAVAAAPDAAFESNSLDPKVLARSPDTAVRQAVASAPDTAPELLYFLARDPAPLVRGAIALNPATPRQADLLLALDEVPEIRTLIAEKMARHLSRHGREETAQLWQLTVSVLDALSRDNLASVRCLVAEMARGLDRVPANIVTVLGRDRAAEVALPALDYLGAIADPELVEIVLHAPDPRIVSAVAKRPSIGFSVSEQIVEIGDSTAIETLLHNRSAEISTIVLDAVIERAPAYETWHEPLVHRPSLTESAAMKLAQFVADRLAKVLHGRTDLVSAQATAQAAAAHRERGATVTVTVSTADETPLARARRHFANGTLTEDLVSQALGGDQDFVIAALSLRSRLKPAVVNKIIVSHSAKGLTSLAWKAGYSMRFATLMQVRLAHLPLKSRLNASSGGSYPLTPAEMDWQIEFFQSLVPAGM